MDDIKQIAQRLGMKQSEITDVVLVDDGAAVQTHDGQWTLITNDDELVFGIDAPTDDAPTADAETAEAEPKKAPPKRRSSR